MQYYAIAVWPYLFVAALIVSCAVLFVGICRKLRASRPGYRPYPREG